VSLTNFQRQLLADLTASANDARSLAGGAALHVGGPAGVFPRVGGEP